MEPISVLKRKWWRPLLPIAVMAAVVLTWRALEPAPGPPDRTMAQDAATAGADVAPGDSRPRPSTAPDDTGEHEHTNHLIGENSPYLQMHAHNPVNWYPWGEEAFQKAKREDKPIFLSVGYSTCYWCQVMERESFVDEKVAEILNEHYVAVKVDRERRPAIDQEYMMATRLMTGRGGWPNSVWLTPEGEPWMAGTYFPRDRFIEILKRLNDAWENRRQQIEEQADRVANAIEKRSGAMAANAGAKPVNRKLIEKALEQYAKRFDEDNGGFGEAPKFPPHGTLRLLMHEYQRESRDPLRKQITGTLDAMWLGGMHDHLGGGFHRYATDAVWKLPHFEKMLYDNAQQVHNFAQAYALFGKERYRQAVADIYRWLERKMRGERGGFYSAIDAEVDGHEGKTYVWHHDEILELLGKEDGRFFAEIYNVEEGGNYVEQRSGEKPGTNVLYLETPLVEIAENRGVEPAKLRKRLASLREKLLDRRLKWKQPEIDDKIVAGWNGLMIEALAYAGRKLEAPRYVARAERAADFVLQYMVEDGGLMRIYRDGKLAQPGYLDDHAYLAAGLLELYRATGHPRWLKRAEWLAKEMLARFEDAEEGAFFYTTNAHDQPLGGRTKSLISGGNTPTPNGTAARVLLALGRITDTPEYTKAAERTLDALSGAMWQSSTSVDALLLAAAHKLAPADPVETPDPSRTGSADRGDGTEKQTSSTASASGSGGKTPVSGEPDAQKPGSPVGIRVFGPEGELAPGTDATIRVALDIDEGWHLYGKNPKLDFLVPSTVTVKGAPERIVVGAVKRPEPKRKKDPVLEKTVNTYTGTIWFEVPISVKEEAAAGEREVAVEVRTQACDDSRCLPPTTRTLRLQLRVAKR